MSYFTADPELYQSSPEIDQVSDERLQEHTFNSVFHQEDDQLKSIYSVQIEEDHDDDLLLEKTQTFKQHPIYEDSQPTMISSDVSHVSEPQKTHEGETEVLKEKTGKPRLRDEPIRPAARRVRRPGTVQKASKLKNIPKYYFSKMRTIMKSVAKRLPCQVHEKLTKLFRSDSVGFNRIKAVLKFEEFRQILEHEYANTKKLEHMILSMESKYRGDILTYLPAMIGAIKDPESFRSWPEMRKKELGVQPCYEC